MRFTIRQFMIIVAIVSLLLFLIIQSMRPGQDPLPLVVLQAVEKKVPGITVENVRQEMFNGKPA
jgi:hypothetical protein